ncbi:hypothetical protein COCVIDRAFT_84735 [Bipolaris victoriae FI3]|uniref:Uncharacterized protein n=1 Tax=Bipolaris victoriae (strain FI3) TaxID=930091 RepID=W7F2S2_BIPV3|nr:hypothetical protein COCVIDRAFT_84735 [Bipolaris victoriae FI3]
MRAALAAGFSPNELDRRPRAEGRALDWAICDGRSVNYAVLKQNLPVVELLLEAGADPRLPSRGGSSPIDSLEAWFKQYEIHGETWAEEDLELKPFFEKALEAMKRTRDELNGEFCTDALLSAHYLFANSRCE